ncbi:MAG: DUF262 domain-containing protein [Bryobacteraceae bacterium]
MSSANDLLELEELELEAEDPTPDEPIRQPFDPSKIRVETKQLSIDSLVARIEHGEIILQPEFQRNEVWKDGARSRLIESIILRIPLPAFYVDATDEDKWLVIDGQQRLSTLRRFVLDQTLRLSGLEFLTSLEGATFDDLARAYQRRIRETNVTVHLIEKGTPPEVKFNIFRRINTGGLPLSAQEIRHALNPGPAGELLKTLASSDEFLGATRGGIPSSRMVDRECVLRFFAFYLLQPVAYEREEFDQFLSEWMSALNSLVSAEPASLEHPFRHAMVLSSRILGPLAFRKRRGAPVNKALFEAWSVNLANLDDAQADALAGRSERLQQKFAQLMNDTAFDRAISQGTSHPSRVRLRFSEIQRIIAETLNDQ